MTRKRVSVAKVACVAGLASVLLVACGQGSSPDGGEVTKLTVPVAEAPWTDSFERLVADYEAETGIDVEVRVFPFDGLLTQEANAAQSGSNAFDLFLINEQWVSQFYDNGWVRPLLEVDPDFVWDENLMEFDGVGRWDPEIRNTSLDGEPYSLPVNGNIHLFMYRTDLYDDLGLSVPETWEDVVANGEAAMAAGAVDQGYVLRGRTPAYDFSAVLYSYGGDWFSDEGSGDFTPAINTPEGRQALEMFRTLAEIGPEAPQTVAAAEATSLMQGGTVLQSMFVAAIAAPLENADASLVAGDIGYAVTPGRTPVSGTWTMGIPVDLPDDRSQAAYDFVTWLTGQEAMQAWEGYGGVTTRTDITTDRPELQAIVDSSEYIRGGFRYSFAPEMVEAVQPIIGEYLAGTITVDDALVQMEEAMVRVVEDSGYAQ